MKSAIVFLMSISCLAILTLGCGSSGNGGTKPNPTTAVLVKPDGTGDYPTIQAAIDADDSADVIEMADGTFRGDGNRDIDFDGKAITLRSQSGNPKECSIDCRGSESDPHRGFDFHHGESSESVIQGVRIIHGYAHTDGGVVINALANSLTKGIRKVRTSYSLARQDNAGLSRFQYRPHD